MKSPDCMATPHDFINPRCAFQMPVLPYCSLLSVVNGECVKQFERLYVFPYLEKNISNIGTISL